MAADFSIQESNWGYTHIQTKKLPFWKILKNIALP